MNSKHGHHTHLDTQGTSVEVLAKNSRGGSRRLCGLEPGERADIIRHLASSLLASEAEIMEANDRDLRAAKARGVTGPLFDRLELFLSGHVINYSDRRLALSRAKLESLSTGLMQIADNSFDNVNRVVRRTRISDTLEVVQKTVPIGVLMVIFESRPDALPQVSIIS